MISSTVTSPKAGTLSGSPVWNRKICLNTTCVAAVFVCACLFLKAHKSSGFVFAELLGHRTENHITRPPEGPLRLWCCGHLSSYWWLASARSSLGPWMETEGRSNQRDKQDQAPKPQKGGGRGAGALHSITKGHSGIGGNGLSIKLKQTAR